MALELFNTLSRTIEPFESREKNRVGMYTCGPTVYDIAHIGNFRAYLFEDLLRRTLEFRGYEVFHVMNLTDVDDKTIKAANEQSVSLNEYTRTFKDAFFEDLEILGVREAHEYPAATEHVDEMIRLIEILIERGLAYCSEDGSVYFSIEKFPNYGCLARINTAELKPGARVSQDEYEKENAGDFALWKARDEEDGEVFWNSPWGQGRPGWHIECSAMSMKYLGQSFDIHAGGVDNIFPHHDDEIAQSEGATGQKFVNYWMHCAHLIVDGKKMSKSLGNFYTLRDLRERGYQGREIRYQLVATHYRQPLNFTLDGLNSARASLKRIDAWMDRLREESSGNGDEATLPEWAAKCAEGFTKALDHDLNISEALAALFDLIHTGNQMADQGTLSPSDAAGCLMLMEDLDQVLGVLVVGEDSLDSEVQEILDDREKVRKAKNWKESDRLRDLLAEKGWSVKDTPQGPKVRRLQGGS